MKVEFLFAWYDIWIGFFWDSKKKWMYFLPLPMFGIILKFNHKCEHCKKKLQFEDTRRYGVDTVCEYCWSESNYFDEEGR